MAKKERNLLLVEDCTEVRELAEFCLRKDGWVVSSAASLAQARLFEGESFDLVLSDYELPDGRGTALLACFESPLVLFSAHPPELVAGVRGVIKKPFDPLRLGFQLERYLSEV